MAIDEQILDSEQESILDSELDQEVSDVSIPENVVDRTSIYASLASGEENSFNSYKRIKESLNFGDQSVLKDIKDSNDAILKQELYSAVEDEVKRAPVEQAKDIIQTYTDVSVDFESDTKKVALENAALQTIDDSSTMAEKARAQGFLNRINERVDASRALGRTFDGYIAKSPINPVNFGTDLLDTLIPGQQVIMGQVAKEILGEHYYVLAGDMERDLGEWIRNHPPEKQAEAAEKVLKSIEKHSGVIADNDLMKVFAMESVRAYATTPGGLDDDTQRYLGNLAGFMELFGILPARWVAKLVKNKLSPANKIDTHSPIGNVSAANPEVGTKVKAGVILDKTGEAEKTFEVSKVDVVLDSLPKPILGDVHLAGTPPKLVDYVEELQGTAKEILSYPDDILVFKSADYANHVKKVDKILKSETDGFVYHPDKYRIAHKPNTDLIEYEAVYGKTALEGFSSKAEALASIEKNFKGLNKEAVAEGNFEVLFHNKVTGAMEEFDPKVHLPGKVDEKALKREIAKAKTKAKDLKAAGRAAGPVGTPKRERLLTEGARWDRAAYNLEKKLKYGGAGDFYVKFSGQSTMPYSSVVSLDPSKIRPIGNIRKWLQGDPHTIFDPEMLNPYIVANEKRFLIDHDLFAISKPFQNLKFKSKKAVADLLRKGDMNGEVYKPADLLAQGYTYAEVKGYLSSRAFWDVVGALKNQTARKELVREGFTKAIEVTDSAGKSIYNNAVKILNKEAVKVNVAYDPIAKKAVNLSKGGLDDVYNRGGKVVQLKSSMDTGDNLYTHAVIYNQNFIKNLPDQVLYNRTGYVFRLNTEPFYIKEIGDVKIDGVLKNNHNRTLGAASSRVEAQRFVDKLKEEYVDELVEEGTSVEEAMKLADKKYTYALDRNIKGALDQVEMDDNILNIQNGYWFSKRGERLQRVDGQLGDIEDPLKAQEKVAKSLANHVAQKDLIESELYRHRKTFPQFYDNSGAYIGRELSDSGKPALKQANAWFNYIEAMRTTPTVVDNIWKEIMLEFDYAIGKLGSEKLSKISSEVLLKRLSNLTPGKAATGTAFTLNLALSPVRQLLLQSSSALHLSGIAPELVGRAYGEGILLSMSLAARNNKVGWASIKKMARGLGYSDKEWETIFNEFRKTGKAYSIDSNLYINELNFGWTDRLPKTAIGTVAHTTANALKTIPRVGKAVGFDAGEIVNQATTWSFARARWEKLNPGKSWVGNKKALQEIAGDARNFAFDMTKTGQLPYQRGALAAMTQFWAINHKMALNMVSKFAGNKRMEDVWGKYVIGVAAMYGLSGTDPLDDIYEWSKEQAGVAVPKELDDLIKGGIFENSLNYSLDLATRNEMGTHQLAWSKSFSPASASFTFAYDAVKALWTGEKTFLEVFSGASGSTYNRLKTASRDIYDIWAYDTSKDTIEKVVGSINEFANKFGDYSKWTRYHAALSNLKRLDALYTTNISGEPMAPASVISELKAKALAGVQLKSEVELWEKILHSADDRKAIDSDARKLADKMVKIYLETENPVEAFQKIREHTMAFAAGNQVYGMEVLELARTKYFNIHPRSKQVMEKSLEYWGLFNPDGDLNYILNTIDNSNLIDSPKEKEQLKDFVRAQFEALRTANKILNQEK